MSCESKGMEKNERPDEEILDFTKPTYVFTPKGSHEWRQQGYYIICKSCDLEHAVWVGAEKVLVGISEGGEPNFKTRKELGML